MDNLETVIEDAIDDAKLNETPTETPTETPSDEAPAESTDEAPAESTGTAEVESPAARAAKGEDSVLEDDFAKKHGLPVQKPGERENRLPYSAVKRIVANAEKKALEPITKELTDYKAKVTDYEARLVRVANFEDVMVNEPAKFLNMLARIPAYAEIFKEKLAPAPQATPQTPAQPVDDMPQPDQTLPDGSQVYSLNGLKALLDWKEAQVEKKIVSQFDSRLAPFEKERKAKEYEESLKPVIAQRIEKARKWPQFNENEEEIVKAMQANPQLDLSEAYQQVVYPKLVADRNSIRAEVLAEMKKAPASTSAGGGALRPSPPPAGPMDTTETIRAAMRQAKIGGYSKDE